MKLLARLCKCTSVPVYFVSCRVFTFHACLLLVKGQLTNPSKLGSRMLRPGLGKPVCLAKSLNHSASRSTVQSTPEWAVLHLVSASPLSPQCPEWASCDTAQGKADFLWLNQRLGFMVLICFSPPPDVWLLLIPNVHSSFLLSVHRPFSITLLASVYGNACWNVARDKLCLSTSSQSTKILYYF